MGRPRKNANQEEVVVGKTTTSSVKESVNEEKAMSSNKKITKSKQFEIADDEEIELMSLTSNVTYWDKSIDETYEWEKVGDIIALPFVIIKNMWRNHKGYLRNFCLKPLDERVIDKLGLNKTYERYEFLTDSSQYTKDNINKIIDAIDASNSSFKSAICNNIKSMIVSGDIDEISVIIALGKKFDVDFISLLD